jgi:hypothetical protein
VGERAERLARDALADLPARKVDSLGSGNGLPAKWVLAKPSLRDMATGRLFACATPHDELGGLTCSVRRTVGSTG